MLQHRVVLGNILTVLLLIGSGAGWVSPAAAIEEADRLWLVAERAYQDGLYGLSWQSLERFVERFPSDTRVPEATLLLGKARLLGGEAGRALEAFRKVQSLSPVPGRPEEARFLEAEALFRLQRYDEARALYERVAAANTASPFVPEALYGIGWVDLQRHKPAAAVTALKQVIDAYPEHTVVPSATVQYARALIELKRYEEAIGALRAFPDRYPDHKMLPEARYLLGYARLAAGRQEGLADLRRFTADHPTHALAPQARRLVIEALLKEGRKADLGEEYKTLMAQQPPTAQGLYDAGVIALRLGRQREADGAWGDLRRSFPDHPLALRASLELAQSAFDRKAYRDAAALGREAAQSQEDVVRGRAFLLLGESELKLKRFGPAHRAFEAAVEAAGGDPDVRYRALAGSGLTLEEQQQWGQAAKLYQEVADQSPDKDLRAWARARRATVVGKSPAPKPAPTGGSPDAKPPAAKTPGKARNP